MIPRIDRQSVEYLKVEGEAEDRPARLCEETVVITTAPPQPAAVSTKRYTRHNPKIDRIHGNRNDRLRLPHAARAGAERRIGPDFGKTGQRNGRNRNANPPGVCRRDDCIRLHLRRCGEITADDTSGTPFRQQQQMLDDVTAPFRANIRRLHPPCPQTCCA